MKITVHVEGRVDHFHHGDPLMRAELAALRESNAVISNGVKMANQAIADVGAGVEAVGVVVARLLSIVGQVVTELGELKAAVGNAIDAGDTAALSNAKDKLTTMQSNLATGLQQLTDAAKAADITPETPVDDGSTPPAVTPLADSFADVTAFDTAVAAYTGPEKVTLDGNVVRDGTDPAQAFVTQGDNTVVRAPA